MGRRPRTGRAVDPNGGADRTGGRAGCRVVGNDLRQGARRRRSLGHPWARRESVAASVRREHLNSDYLPGVRLPENIDATSDFDEALDGVDAVVLGVPSQALRENLRVFRDSLPPTVPIVSLAKGVELGTGQRMSEVIAEVGQVDAGPDRRARPAPTSPSRSPSGNRRPRWWPAPTTTGPCAVQEASATPLLPAVHQHRRHRREIGGTGKNVIALACGIADGLGFGDNTSASLITRGLAETARLGRRTRRRPADLRRPGRAG